MDEQDDGFSYDIGPEDAVPVLIEQRNNLLNQLTSANIELMKARSIISKLNEEVQALKGAQQTTKEEAA